MTTEKKTEAPTAGDPTQPAAAAASKPDKTAPPPDTAATLAALRKRRRAKLTHVAAAAAVFIVSLFAIMRAQRHHGVVRDEVVYIGHGYKYATWWGRLITADGVANNKEITRHFGGKRATANNREHPPLVKTLSGISQKILSDKFGWMSRLSAARLPTAGFGALLVMLVFLFGKRVWTWRHGLCAAALTLLLPRAFFHAGLATFDTPIAALWFAAMYAYYLALSSRAWTVGLGIVCGLALATKHNAIILPVPILVHYLYISFRQAKIAAAESASGATIQQRTGGDGPRSKWSYWPKKMMALRPSVFLSMLLIGPLVLIALWPWLWFDTTKHLGDWLSFHFEHVHYNFEYLGHNWNAPPYPWHVPIVTTLFTVPVATLVAGGIGAAELWRRARTGTADDPAYAPMLLLFLSAGAAMGPFLLTTSPIFGAEKHFAAAMPTICLFASVGVFTAARRLCDALIEADLLSLARDRLVRPLAGAVLAAAVVGAALAETVAAQPYALSHYNALAGGAPGGADYGMNRQFWGYSARGVLPILNEAAEAAPGGKLMVYSHDASPTLGTYKREGLLSPKVRDTGLEYSGIRRSEYAIVVHEKHFNRHDYMIWNNYGTVQPVYVLTFQGVPIVSVYKRPQRSNNRPLR